MTEKREELATPEAPPAPAVPKLRIGRIGELQRGFSGAFTETTPQSGLLATLAAIAKFFGATYVTAQGRFGPFLLAEEWTAPAFEGSDDDNPLREKVQEVMCEAMAANKIQCKKVGRDPYAFSIIGATITDRGNDAVGAIGIACPFSGKEETLQTLGQFESTVSVLGLALEKAADDAVMPGDVKEPLEKAAKQIQAEGADQPVRIAFDIVAKIKNSYDLDQASIGFVQGKRVKVRAICGLDEIRLSNPGVRQIAAAMEECVDFEAPVLWQETVLGEAEDFECDMRLHRQWSRSIGGDSVGSVPLFYGEEIAAVLSVRNDATEPITHKTLEKLGKELEVYSSLIPVSRMAYRSLATHVTDSMRKAVTRVVGGGYRRTVTMSTLLALLLIWLVFGTMSFGVAVPCTIQGSETRTISSPREGILLESLAKAGEYVREGQVLARLDAEDELLRKQELEAQIRTLTAVSDKALADANAAQGRVLAAQQKELEAELALVEHRIREASIRSPSTGILLSGSLDKRIGARLAIGETLFEVAKTGKLSVEIHIPERWYEAGRTCEHIEFSANARPDERIPLDNFQLSPVARVKNGKNVFYGQSTDFEAPEYLSPGMSGIAHLELGRRPIWWVMSYRILDWLRMKFWI